MGVSQLRIWRRMHSPGGAPVLVRSRRTATPQSRTRRRSRRTSPSPSSGRICKCDLRKTTMTPDNDDGRRCRPAHCNPAGASTAGTCPRLDPTRTPGSSSSWRTSWSRSPPPPPKWPCPSTPERTRCRHRFRCRRRRRCRHRHRCSSPQKKTCPTGVPTLRGQARVRAGAHPARVGVRLRLDAPQRGRNRGGVGSDAVSGGVGADRVTCLRMLERAAAAAANVARDGAALMFA